MANQYSIRLSAAEADSLRRLLAADSCYRESSREYASFCYEGADVSLAFYPKRGKLLLQGKGADAFVRGKLHLDPRGDSPAPSLHSTLPALVDERPHFGVDESGKGDYFGPLVVAGVYSCPETAHKLLAMGCRDSKSIPDDDAIMRLAAKVCALPGVACEVICIGPRRYNELYAEVGNLNRLLAWAHARVIAALHEKVPACPRALSDQFAKEWVLQAALGKRHIPVELEQRTKGESDVAVAAASILARARFVKWMRDTAAAAGCDLPLGCAPHVVKAARAFVARHGRDRLADVAKLHFKVTGKL